MSLVLALRDQFSWAIIDVITRTGDCPCTRPLCYMPLMPATSLENEQDTTAKMKCLTKSLDILEGAQIYWIRLTLLNALSLFSRVSWCGTEFLVLYSGSSRFEFCPGRSQLRVFCPSTIMVFRDVRYYNWEFLWVFSVSSQDFSSLLWNNTRKNPSAIWISHYHFFMSLLVYNLCGPNSVN